jgi:Putative transposase
LAKVMQCGVAMLQDALAGVKRCVLEAGYIVVLETAGRAGHWHPHLHILMTSGGVTSEQRWQEVDYFPFEVLHKKWQYYLLMMVKERVGTQEIRHTVDALWRRYCQGFVAYWEKGKVPAGGEGLAYYLARYVVSPPTSLRRILRYDGLHATCKAKKVRVILQHLLVALGRADRRDVSHRDSQELPRAGMGQHGRRSAAL